jgi:hypothetical protein
MGMEKVVDKMSFVSRLTFSINILRKETAGHVRHSSGRPSTLFAVFGIKWYVIISKSEMDLTSKTFLTVPKMAQIVRRRVLVEEGSEVF